MRRVALLSVALLSVCGCERGKSSGSETPDVPPPRLFRFDDVKPTGTPPVKARLILDGLPVPVSVKTERKDNQFTIELLSHEELFDYEKYVIDGETSFALFEGAGEQCEPPIPLLTFPFTFIDAPRTWQGTLSSERIPHPAHATIHVEKDTVTMSNASIDAIHVRVDIVIDGSTIHPERERRLNFWFAPDKGLLKREFGTSSIREPVSE